MAAIATAPGTATTTMTATAPETGPSAFATSIHVAPPRFTTSDFSFSNAGPNVTLFIILSVVIIIYYALFSSLGMNVTPNTSSTTTQIIEFLLWTTFILLILLNGIAYIFHIDILQSLKNLWSNNPTVQINVTPAAAAPSSAPVPTISDWSQEQVFHIADNKYGYEDAKAICAAYGARMATYKDIDTAYTNGADFCSYGWSDGQMALYPTQYEKWEKMQKLEGHEHDCGHPGINGGYIGNPDVQFGVNCFGVKPRITPQQATDMQNTPLYPKTIREREFDTKVEMWRTKINELTMAPFNHTQWSQ